MFLSFRILRIVPALAVEVLLSALILGAVFTTLPLRDYFSAPGLWRYFGNIAGFVDYFLPGVFLSNPLPEIVNNSLWTLPPEFYCYGIVSALMLSGLFYRREPMLAGVGLAYALLTAHAIHSHLGETPGNLPTEIVVFYFFAGCAFYVARDFLVASLPAAISSLLLGYWATYHKYVMLAPPLVTYGVVVLGSLSWPKVAVLKKGDYSYGIYLYHFPICQAVIATLPQLGEHVVIFKTLSLTATAAFAVASWHLLEKPALGLKAYLVRSAREILPEHYGRALSEAPAEPISAGEAAATPVAADAGGKSRRPV